MHNWTLTKRFKFEASHQLPWHDGKCRRLHGHSWKGAVICKGEILQPDGGTKGGMLMDYADISKLVDPIVEKYLDHYHLNDSLDMLSPTSELIAQWIFRQLEPHLPLLHAVEIEETCTSACRYENRDGEKEKRE
jgi:6-pyruvoyltetrahydropterin/6-carboxytetrahydropterin synthase